MLKIEDLSISLSGKPVLEHISFSLTPHTFTAVLGKNGCGKSTLVSCINRQLHYTGKILYQDQDLALLPPKERAKLMAVLPQTLPPAKLMTEDLVMFGRNPYLDFGRRPTEKDLASVSEAMKQAGVSALVGKPVNKLSGGERQKVYLAMILAQQTRLLVLDEPTTYMDIENEASFLNTLSSIKKHQKKTLLVIMHDLSQAIEHADRLIVLENHRVLFDGDKKDCLQQEILEKVFHVKRYEAEEDGHTHVFFSA